MVYLLALRRLEFNGRDLKKLAEDGDTELSAAESLGDFIFEWCGPNLSCLMSHRLVWSRRLLFLKTSHRKGC